MPGDRRDSLVAAAAALALGVGGSDRIPGPAAPLPPAKPGRDEAVRPGSKARPAALDGP
ncbi:hypothetical protein LRE75_21955 [Streptomyces sp. 372A]